MKPRPKQNPERKRTLGPDVYSSFRYKGKTLKDWQKACRFNFSLGELYRMALNNEDFDKLVIH